MAVAEWKVAMNNRTSGILLHLTSLANKYLIGDLGPAAIAFADFLVESGQNCWQMLPIGPTGKLNSPYNATSGFAGNSLLISPELLMEGGLLGRQDVKLPVSWNEEIVTFSAAARSKLRWLKSAFMRFEKNNDSSQQSELDAFIDGESYWIEDFSLFSAIAVDEGTSNWTLWDRDVRMREPEAMLRARKHFASNMRYHQFIQWQFSVQWKALRAYCASKGICLVGDVPMFVAHHSADVWAHRELFKLDSYGNPAVVAGVPPDYFSRNGQVWGLPVYCWEELHAQKYGWWIERLQTACSRFDLNRLDHFIGFVRTYEVPSQARTAANGRYQPGGGGAFFQAVREALGGFLPFIADDLGAKTPEVEALMQQFQIPGMRVLQFEAGTALETGSLPSENYPASSWVYTGTQDNDTTMGWYLALAAKQREALRVQLRTSEQDVVWAIIREALISRAETAMIPAQDLLGLGSAARMNFPGTLKGNWKWRLKNGALTKELAQELKSITASSERWGGGQPGPTRQSLENDLKPGIAEEAYAIYERGGRQNGHAVQDWLRAEQVLQSASHRT